MTVDRLLLVAVEGAREAAAQCELASVAIALGLSEEARRHLARGLAVASEARAALLIVLILALSESPEFNPQHEGS